jgi:exodeoxyribonuclease VIII
VKTTLDASTDAFCKNAVKLGYDLQTAMYSEGVEKKYGEKPDFVFLAIEKEPPYAVNIFIASEEFYLHGIDKFREYLGIYHDCKNTGNWWGYLGKSQQVNTLDLPAWLKAEN